MRHDTESAHFVIERVAELVLDRQLAGGHTREGAIERLFAELPEPLRQAVSSAPTVLAEAFERAERKREAFERAMRAALDMECSERVAEARDRARVLSEQARG